MKSSRSSPSVFSFYPERIICRESERDEIYGEPIPLLVYSESGSNSPTGKVARRGRTREESENGKPLWRGFSDADKEAGSVTWCVVHLLSLQTIFDLDDRSTSDATIEPLTRFIIISQVQKRNFTKLARKAH